MDMVTFKVCVQVDHAIQAGMSEYGRRLVSVSLEELRDLTRDEIDFILPLGDPIEIDGMYCLFAPYESWQEGYPGIFQDVHRKKQHPIIGYEWKHLREWIRTVVDYRKASFAAAEKVVHAQIDDLKIELEEFLAIPDEKFINLDYTTPVLNNQDFNSKKRPARYAKLDSLLEQIIEKEKRVVALYDLWTSRVTKWIDAIHEMEKRDSERKRKKLKEDRKAFIDEVGTLSQLERFEAGVLSLDELRDLIRKVIFDEEFFGSIFLKSHELVRDIEKYKKACVTHESDCLELGANKPDERWEVSPASTMNEEEWELKRYIEGYCSVYRLTQGARISPRKHTGMCRRCGKYTSKFGVLVEVTFLELVVSQEYSFVSSNTD